MPITIDVFKDSDNKMFQGVCTYLINDYPMLKSSDKKSEEVYKLLLRLNLHMWPKEKILVFM